MRYDKIMPCFLCMVPVKVNLDRGDISGADDAVICQTTGNYGSRAIDDPPFVLEFVICDLCIVSRRLYFHAHTTEKVMKTVDYLNHPYTVAHEVK